MIVCNNQCWVHATFFISCHRYVGHFLNVRATAPLFQLIFIKQNVDLPNSHTKLLYQLYLSLVSHILYQVSCLMHPVSCILSHIYLSHISCLTYPVSTFKYWYFAHVSCFTFPVSCILSHVSCLTSPVSRPLSHVPCLTSRDSLL